jgi:glycosyltransferase involved in cell wall biosynthesis
LSAGRELVEKIVEWGSLVEGSTVRKPLLTVRRFYEQLQARGELDDYFEKARRHVRRDSVVLTGYLTHSELRYLFPAADAAVFPSVVAEAGPLVFLEAMASGCFPLGTYFAGMAASIDSVASRLAGRDAEVMKLSAEEESTVREIAAKTPEAIRLADRYRQVLREVAVERYDWSNVARKFAAELRTLG